MNAIHQRNAALRRGRTVLEVSAIVARLREPALQRLSGALALRGGRGELRDLLILFYQLDPAGRRRLLYHLSRLTALRLV